MPGLKKGGSKSDGSKVDVVAALEVLRRGHCRVRSGNDCRSCVAPRRLDLGLE